MNPIQNKIKSWLLNSDICNSSGGVYSWINPAHTGYIYPEIMGYYLSFLTQLYEKEIDLNNKNFFIGKTIKHINYLNQLLEAGGIGREQILYTFDTGICLTGLLRVKKIYQDENKELNNCINNMILFVLECLNQKKAAIHKEKRNELFNKEKWSLSYGCLLIKLAIPLYLLYESTHNPMYKQKAITLAKELISRCFHEDHFSINEYIPWVYTHPHCYATEGLLFLQKKGIHDFDEIIIKSAEWLVKQQNSDGSLYSWYYRPGVEKVKNGDCNAQAIRIWIAVDSKKYKENIEKGFAFIQTLQSPEGGLYYSPESKDINSWVSLFAWQAYNWKLHGINCEDII